MKHRVLAAMILCLLLALLTAGAGLAGGGGGGPETLPPSMRAYHDQAVDSRPGLSFGAFLSMVRDPLNGRFYISYFDSGNGSLMLAGSDTGTEGNCGPTHNWACEVVDNATGMAGVSVSMDVYDDASYHKIGIAYVDASSLSVKFAEYACVKGILCVWSPVVVQVSDKAYYPGPAFPGVHQSAVLKYDRLGVPHIAFTAYKKSVSSVGTELWYATYTGSSGTGCGTGSSPKWNCVPLLYRTAGNTGAGLFPGLQFNAANQPRVAYYDATLPFIEYFRYANGDWGTPVSVTAASVAGLSFVLQQMPTGEEYPRIAYLDATSPGRLKHAQYLGVNGGSTSCGLPGSADYPHWQCDTVAEVGTSAAGVSLAIDPGGYSVIAYEDASDMQGPAVLRLAQMWTRGVGNCGAPGNAIQWHCEAVAVPPVSEISIGSYANLLIDQNGLGMLAYTMDDDYYQTRALHFARQMLPIFMPLVRR